MEKMKLQIAAKKYNSESAVVTMRLPKDMLDDLDNAAGKTGRTRNEIMNLCLEFALNHMEIISNSKSEGE